MGRKTVSYTDVDGRDLKIVYKHRSGSPGMKGWGVMVHSGNEVIDSVNLSRYSSTVRSNISDILDLYSRVRTPGDHVVNELDGIFDAYSGNHEVREVDLD